MTDHVHEYLPHGYCFLWEPALLFTHLGSDLLIGLSYVAISATLLYLVLKARQALPFSWVFIAFGAFIVACGMTHFMDIYTLWVPAYWHSGMVKIVTAIASVATAIILPTMVPRTLGLIDAAKLSEQRKVQLETNHRELSALYDRLKQADELKTRFFANVSHELRTPLTLILGPTKKWLSQVATTEGLQQDLQVIHRNAQTLLRHVNDLLDVARLDAGRMAIQPSPIDLARLLRRVASYFDTLAQERRIAFTLEAPETLPAIADAQRLEQVLLNLISNAFKFTPDGGWIRCAMVQRDECAIIAVEDSGPGVPAELRERIFEPFQQVEESITRRHGGTGLGLSIVRELVVRHGGSVRAEEAVGGGARFVITLPLTAPARAPGTAPAALDDLPPEQDGLAEQIVSELRPQRNATLAVTGDPALPLALIVEDNPEMRRFVAETLAGRYRVATAMHGADGLALARTERPDIIISDVMMPGMGGDALVQAVRELPDLDMVPIVMLTAKADDELRLRLLGAGAQDYLIKPFTPEELQVRVDNLVSMKRARDVLQRELASKHMDVAGLADDLARRNQELRQALAARDDFLSSAAHALKTPVTSVLLQAQVLEREAQRIPVRASELSRIQHLLQELRRLRDTVQTLLDVAESEQGKIVSKLERTDVAEIARQSCVVARSNVHRVVCDISEPLPAEIDLDRMRQVFDQLLDNATKFSRQGGEVRLSGRQEDGAIHLTVHDSGVGIPAQDLPRVFDRLYRGSNADDRQYPGLGLGLFIVRAIVEQHGGRIWIESDESGGGTTVHILLPLAPVRGRSAANLA